MDEFDHHSAHFAGNWRETYAAMRGCPAHTAAHGGFTVLTRYDDVKRALLTPSTFVCGRELEFAGQPVQGGVTIPVNPFRMGMMEMDRPESTVHRKLLVPWFSARATENNAAHIRDMVTWCLDRVIETGRMDVVDDIANPLPALITLDLLGLPLQNWERYAQVLHEAAYRAKGSAKGVAWLLDDLRSIVAHRRAEPAAIPTPLDAMLAADADGAPLPVDVVVEMTFMLLNGGIDTSTALIAHSLRYLSAHPDARRSLVDDPALIPGAVEEFLRFFTPGTGLGRTVAEPVTIGTVDLHPGDRVFLALGAANTDPDEFAEPDRVDFERDGNRHLAFGSGLHRCLGAFLAPREMAILLEEVLRRMPDLEVDEAGVRAYASIPLVAGYEAMPARFTPGPRTGRVASDGVPPARDARVPARGGGGRGGGGRGGGGRGGRGRGGRGRGGGGRGGGGRRVRRAQWCGAMRAPDLPAFHAARRPAAVALTDHDTGASYTWAELDDRVGRAATVLRDDFSIAPGDRVAVVCENDPRVFELQFACMRIGAIFVPLNWRLALPELQEIVQDAAPSLVVHDDEWQPVAAALGEKQAVPTLSWGSPGGRYEAALGAAAPLPPQAHDLDELTHILYTSGTTGTPKGALSSHGTLLWQAVNLSHVSGTTGPSHQLNPLPLFHAGGLLTVAMPVLHFGGRVTTMRRFRPDVIVDLLAAREDPVTHLAMIPMMYAAITAQPGFAGADLSHVRCAVVAGAIAPPELLQTWHDRGAGMQPQYGGTEMGPCALVLEVGEIEKAKLGSSGRPPLHTEIRLVDARTGAVPAPGRIGEIQLRGPSVTRGYWGRPAGESRDADGWFHTGDVAWRDEDGYFYYSGRSKEMYKSGGENVYPAEVEVVLVNCPEVEEIAVVGVPDATWGEVGLAVVVATAGRTPTVESLREFGAGRLATYKLPVALVVVDALARNVTGKVSREQLRELYRRRTS